jgi:hypothetical protein
MLSEDRRSFVKKSLATSMTFTFTGLIRAHGEEVGGGTTTWNPEESTAETSDSGGTTTWNPEESTFEASSVETTWNPDGSTVETTDGGSTTWDPDASTVDSTIDSTTWDPDETTEPETTEAQEVEVTKTQSENVADPSATAVPAGSIKVTDKDDATKVFYECLLTWSVGFGAKTGFEAQPNKVKKDCLSCESTGAGFAGQPKLSLHLGTPSKSSTKMNNFQTAVLDAKFVRTAPKHVRGYVAEGVKTEEGGKKVAKVKTTGPEGQEEAKSTDLSVMTKITGAMDPANGTDAASKTVTWTVEFSAPGAAGLQGDLETEVKKIFNFDDHKVEVKLNGLPTTLKIERKQTVTASLTSDEVKDGAGCSCTP